MRIGSINSISPSPLSMEQIPFNNESVPKNISPVRRLNLKPVNTGGQKHVVKTVKNSENIPDPAVS